ncbi:cardiolipin synthase [Corynebacterium kutscheri]|uniref:Cardiolipin synthase n=1 Tax=Corynebacterium kutscheri TaxID=35755 RepID=A0A0F6TDW1_9CORY|nr:cardiolipin synthase [Corynebacterium kutscheri]AKE42004.1 cardiolipin synthase [Corynebacterium kutscheri]VEH06184.1 cardiolipin synthase [Corynebacterium kutscheri]VEH10345.1 cardiolipin synthase [Corynebacterium kutscheri]VEH82097.1 cardiolipin synthase [Corynebacterium kutscheri]
MLNWSFVDVSGWQTIGLIIDYGIRIIAVGTIPEGRRPSSSTAWLLVILLIPVVGLPLFFLMGSPQINRRRHRVQEEANKYIGDIQKDVPDFPSDLLTDKELQSLVRLNRKLTGFPAVQSVNLGMHTDYRETIQRMTDAVDQAKEYINVEIYIVAWDKTTDVFFQALKRAVDRGVKVRLLFDHVGSWKYPGYSKLGKRLDAIGIDWYLMLPIQPLRWRFRRPDLRNHRKMVIIDGEIGFMGSQNMIDSSYLSKKNIKAGRHWVDTMFELTGPIVNSMNKVFAVDWYLESDENIELDLADWVFNQDQPNTNITQLVPSGPGYSTEPSLRIFNSVIHHAKNRLIMCSPYFIPDESMIEAVTTACYRGVTVELYVSEQGDQFMVEHAQSSYYQALLEAGVRIYQYKAPYVLHTKYMLADPDALGNEAVAIVGSANMDMRSFGLNYEVSLMCTSGDIIDDLNDLTEQYQSEAIELTLTAWNKRSKTRRYIDNVMRLTSALQ